MLLDSGSSCLVAPSSLGLMLLTLPAVVNIPTAGTVAQQGVFQTVFFPTPA